METSVDTLQFRNAVTGFEGDEVSESCSHSILQHPWLDITSYGVL